MKPDDVVDFKSVGLGWIGMLRRGMANDDGRQLPQGVGNAGQTGHRFDFCDQGAAFLEQWMRWPQAARSLATRLLHSLMASSSPA